LGTANVAFFLFYLNFF